MPVPVPYILCALLRSLDAGMTGVSAPGYINPPDLWRSGRPPLPCRTARPEVGPYLVAIGTIAATPKHREQRSRLHQTAGLS